MEYYPNLLKNYKETIVPHMQKKFKYKNIMEVPKLEKIVINIGVGEAIENSKLLDDAIDELTVITGQRPTITKAKKAISNFKIRAGVPIGCYVTLRSWRMYEFLDRLVNVAIPRVRDFRGLPVNSMDGRGNYNMGLKEQIVFPEIDYDKIEQVRGMNITIVTTAESDEEAFELLKSFGMPFEKKATEAA